MGGLVRAYFVVLSIAAVGCSSDARAPGDGVSTAATDGAGGSRNPGDSSDAAPSASSGGEPSVTNAATSDTGGTGGSGGNPWSTDGGGNGGSSGSSSSGGTGGTGGTGGEVTGAGGGGGQAGEGGMPAVEPTICERACEKKNLVCTVPDAGCEDRCELAGDLAGDYGCGADWYANMVCLAGAALEDLGCPSGALLAPVACGAEACAYEGCMFEALLGYAYPYPCP